MRPAGKIKQLTSLNKLSFQASDKPFIISSIYINLLVISQVKPLMILIPESYSRPARGGGGSSSQNALALRPNSELIAAAEVILCPGAVKGEVEQLNKGRQGDIHFGPH